MSATERPQLNLTKAQYKELAEALKIRLTPYIPHVPHPTQHAFLWLQCLEALYGGAAGGGKSDALLMAALQYVDVPSYNAILFRKTYADLNLPGSLIPRSHEWLSQTDAKWNENDSRWTFPSGATLSFGYMRNDEDRHRYQCFAPGTEILTEHGWQAVQDVEVGTLAATLDPKTREMSYEPVTQTQEYDFDGNLVEVFGLQGVAFSVTSEHAVWHTTPKNAELTWRHADALPATAHIPQWAKWSGGISPGDVTFVTSGSNGKTVAMDSHTWASFLGWYLAEGSLTPAGVQLAQHTEPGISIIKAVLGRIDGHWRFDEREGRFVIASKTLRSYLSHLGLAREKFIPADVLGWDQEHLQLLLNAVVEGDGTWRNGGESGHFVSSSKQLADDVCEIGFKCGYRPTICERTEVTNYSRGRLATRWHVSLLRKSTDTALPSGWKDRCLVPYKGPVYCVTVPPYHTVLIRYRGRVSWSGQSAEFQFVGFDELTHFSKLQYTYMFSRVRKPKDLSHRNPLSKVPLRVRAASNPGGRGHLWVKLRFIKPRGQRDDEPEDPTQRVFIPAKLHDNPSVDAESYTAALEQLDEATQMQLIHGDWDAREPGPWVIPDPTWIDAAVVKGAELWEAGGIPRDWEKPVVLCIDWGEFTQAYNLWPMPNGGVYVLPSEVVGEHEDPASVGLRMLKRAEMSGIRPTVANYDAAGIQSMRTFASTARARPGWERLKTRKIAFGKYKRESMNYLRLLFKRAATDKPDRYIAIHPENAALIRQLRGWVRKNDESEDVEKFDDHGCDALVAGVAHTAADHRAYIDAMINQAKKKKESR